MTSLIWVLGAYLVGAIPFALIYSVWVEKEDVRSRGSSNVGATNVIRNYGWLPGIVVLLLDMMKGGLPVAGVLYLHDPASIWLAITVGMAAIVGHIFPVYLQFSGGKGVATSTGVFAVLSPLPLLIALVFFLAMVVTTRYMSVGSLTGAALLPVFCGFFYGLNDPVTGVATLLALVVFWTHRENIMRLVRGEENTFF